MTETIRDPIGIPVPFNPPGYPLPSKRVLFKLEGAKSNKSAIGARVTVKTENSVQFNEVRGGGSYLSQNDPRLHLGLGPDSKMTQVEIRWPNGKIETLRDLQADFIYTVVEEQGITNRTPLPAAVSSSPSGSQ